MSEPYLKKLSEIWNYGIFFISLHCSNTWPSSLKRGGERPSETHYGHENKCHFGHTAISIDSDFNRGM